MSGKPSHTIPYHDTDHLSVSSMWATTDAAHAATVNTAHAHGIYMPVQLLCHRCYHFRFRGIRNSTKPASIKTPRAEPRKTTNKQESKQKCTISSIHHHLLEATDYYTSSLNINACRMVPGVVNATAYKGWVEGSMVESWRQKHHTDIINITIIHFPRTTANI